MAGENPVDSGLEPRARGRGSVGAGSRPSGQKCTVTADLGCRTLRVWTSASRPPSRSVERSSSGFRRDRSARPGSRGCDLRYPVPTRHRYCMDFPARSAVPSRAMQPIRIETVHDMIRGRYGLNGWCREHGFHDIDRQVLVAHGLGDRPVRDLKGRLTCAHCRLPLELHARAPRSYSPEWNATRR